MILDLAGRSLHEHLSEYQGLDMLAQLVNHLQTVFDEKDGKVEPS